MKIITNTYYQANDGIIFDTQDDCEEYEDYINSEAQLEKLSCLVNTKMRFSLVSDFIYNNYDKIKEIMEGKPEDESTVNTEVNWSEVPAGTIILVRDSEEDDWVERNFVRREPCGLFVCYLKTEYSTLQAVHWKFAKLKP